MVKNIPRDAFRYWIFARLLRAGPPPRCPRMPWEIRRKSPSPSRGTGLTRISTSLSSVRKGQIHHLSRTHLSREVTRLRSTHACVPDPLQTVSSPTASDPDLWAQSKRPDPHRIRVHASGVQPRIRHQGSTRFTKPSYSGLRPP